MSASTDARGGAVLRLELGEQDLRQLAEMVADLLGTGSSSEQRPWLDVGEAAEYIRCPKSRIYALVSAGRLPHHKDGSRLLFRREELDNWIRLGGAKRP